jgi:GntR family transcriptional regulator/MocR family aminotransferase
MPRRRTSSSPVALIPLDGRARAPLYEQLADGLRSAILEGKLAPGGALPAARVLATDLDVSRTTVLEAYAQLQSEGYLETLPRSATRVKRALPDALLRAPAHTRRGDDPPALAAAPSSPPPRLSARGRRMVAAEMRPMLEGRKVAPLLAAGPAVDLFPHALWERLSRRRWGKARRLLGYGDRLGYAPLREAIAEHVSLARGVRCTPDQVIVVNGSQQALDLVARVLFDAGDAMWVEDPGYLGARSAFRAAGVQLVPVPVDDDGLLVATGIKRAPRARGAYVTPSRQYPTGGSLSAGRRLELLAWAAKVGAWVIEDDYDSEFRYASRPLPSMQGLDATDRVAYVGTFSKTLFPALRLGYLVVPEALAPSLAAAREISGLHAPLVEQAVLSDFLREGHYVRHVRRMRLVYEERRDVLVQALARECGDRLRVGPHDGGMHLTAWLPRGMHDVEVATRLREHGVLCTPLSQFRLRRSTQGGLLLGYAGYGRAEIEQAVEVVGRELR